MSELTLHPLTPDRWPDLERLFGARGACGGCWCMWWRLEARVFAAGKGEGNRSAMRALVASGAVPGLLACSADGAVGWCAVAPREDFVRLRRSRTLRPVDDREVWSVPCFFVARSHRGRGVARLLLDGAAGWARAHGATVLEGYAVEPRTDRMPDVFAFQGPVALYRAAGFVEVARRSPTRPIMRREL